MAGYKEVDGQIKGRSWPNIRKKMAGYKEIDCQI
jgi:hypothetical protein